MRQFLRRFWVLLSTLWLCFFILIAMGGGAHYNPSGFYGMMIWPPIILAGFLELVGWVFAPR